MTKPGSDDFAEAQFLGADHFFADSGLALFPHLETDFDAFGDLGDDVRRPERTPDAKAARREYVQVQTRGLKSHASQQNLWARGEVFALSVAAKLREFGRHDLLEGLETCHTEATNAKCSDCGRVNKFYNRCDLFYCPRCQPRLAREREEGVRFWAQKIRQPKHVVLTMTNTRDLTKKHVRHLVKSFAKLRRRAFAKHWRGGFYRVELTNEGKGWHLHLHALIDADYIDARKLSVQWDDCNGGYGHIVKVKDARGLEYLAEVTKYAVKGNQLAEWTGAQIAEFVDAFKGVRTFGVFGELYGMRSEWKEHLGALAEKRAICPCGSSHYTLHSDKALEWMELHVNSPVERSPEPPKGPFQLELGIIVRDAFNLFG